jgi:hypothetical protein
MREVWGETWQRVGGEQGVCEARAHLERSLPPDEEEDEGLVSYLAPAV